jgi:hypothetical protein
MTVLESSLISLINSQITNNLKGFTQFCVTNFMRFRDIVAKCIELVRAGTAGSCNWLSSS